MSIKLELLKATGSAITQVPALALTAFTGFFMTPFAESMKISLELFFGSLGKSDEEIVLQYLYTRYNMPDSNFTESECRDLSRLISRNGGSKEEALTVLFNKGWTNFEESMEYLKLAVKNPANGLTEESIDNYLRIKFPSEYKSLLNSLNVNE